MGSERFETANVGDGGVKASPCPSALAPLPPGAKASADTDPLDENKFVVSYITIYL